MFGYIRPLKSELKVREFEQFKACYCSLCHSLGKEYGAASRFILNYDFTFLAMLLWNREIPICYETKRCIASPFKKKCTCTAAEPMKRCAAYSVILAYWKLKDSIADKGFFRSLPDRGASIALIPAYKRASKDFPEFSGFVSSLLKELNELEESGESSMDRCADKFALILSHLSDHVEDEAKRRMLQQLFYHTGRWIYIVDAVNDIKEDMSAGEFNPVAVKYELKTPDIDDSIKNELRMTLLNSENIIISAFSLMEETGWSEIIKNIIYLGMPDIRERVFDGTFKNTKEGLPR